MYIFLYLILKGCFRFDPLENEWWSFVVTSEKDASRILKCLWYTFGAAFAQGDFLNIIIDLYHVEIECIQYCGRDSVNDDNCERIIISI